MSPPTPQQMILPARSFARIPIRIHCSTINNNKAITTQLPMKPNSSPMIAKIKSVCGSRIKLPVFYRGCCIIIQSFSGKLSGTNCHNRVVLLIGSIICIFIRFKEGKNTFLLVIFQEWLVRLHNNAQKDNCCRNQDYQNSSDKAVTESCNINQKTDYYSCTDRCGKVWLHNDKRNGNPARIAYLQSVLRSFTSRSCSIRNFAKKSISRIFAISDGWKVVNPRSIHLVAPPTVFTCNKYQPQYKNRKAIEKPVKIKQPDIINECDDHHKDNSDHDPQYLTTLIYLLGTSYNSIPITDKIKTSVTNVKL